MAHVPSSPRLGMTELSVLALLIGVPLAAGAQTTLSNNLSSASGGTDTVTGQTWLTSSFGTGASAYNLSSITLLLNNPIAGTAELDLYTDAKDYLGGSGLQPGTQVAALTSPASYSTTTLSNTTFTANGITLAANSTYWAVLKAGSGTFNWSFTNSNTGAGTGFQHTFGESDDAGATWFTDDTYPQQMSVVATAAAPVPEASTAVSFGVPFGLLGMGLLLLRRKAKTKGAHTAN